jgi:hypothetical protein
VRCNGREKLATNFDTIMCEGDRYREVIILRLAILGSSK